jgi:hypothetical protein
VRLKEQRLYDSLKRNKPRDFWLHRVENMVNTGTPDLHCAVRAGDATWLELKAVTAPARASTRLLGVEGLNTDQINWHTNYTQLGHHSYVLIRDNRRRLFLIHGSWADEINNLPAAELTAINSADSWCSIFEVLRSAMVSRPKIRDNALLERT